MLKGNETIFSFLILEAEKALLLWSSKYKLHHLLYFIPTISKFVFQKWNNVSYREDNRLSVFKIE